MFVVGSDLSVLRICARLVKGQKIQAIKLRRELTGEGLREAKQWCDEAYAHLSEEGATANKYDCNCEELRRCKREAESAHEQLFNAEIELRRKEEFIADLKRQVVESDENAERVAEIRDFLRGIIVDGLKS